MSFEKILDRLQFYVDILKNQLVIDETPLAGSLAGDSRARLDYQVVAQKLWVVRSERSALLPTQLLGEPVWDMLLYLYAVEGRGRGEMMKAVTSASRVPWTTACRWLQAMEGQGLVTMEGDERDGRRRLVRLTDDGVRRVGGAIERIVTDFLS